MNILLISLLVLFLTYAANRFIMTAATKKLEDSEKLRIFEVFSKRNNYSTIFLVVTVLLYFGVIQLMPRWTVPASLTFFVVFILYSVFRFVSNYRKLKQLEIPAGYINSFFVSYGIFALGFLGIVLGFLLKWIG